MLGVSFRSKLNPLGLVNRAGFHLVDLREQSIAANLVAPYGPTLDRLASVKLEVRPCEQPLDAASHFLGLGAVLANRREHHLMNIGR